MKNTPPKKELPKHPVTLKVYLLRKHNNVSQLALAEFIRIGKNKLSRIERDEDEYSEANIEAIKECFKIMAYPLSEQERAIFKARLYYWLELIREKMMDEAKFIQEEMKKIDNLLPCDFEMVMLCKMIEVKLFIAEGNYISAEEKLNISQDYLDKMGNESLFHYYYGKGVLCVHNNCYECGLGFLLQANDLMEDNAGLIPKDDGYFDYYIAMCYSYIELPYQAISFWEKAREAHPDKSIKNFTLTASRGLAQNYIKMNQFRDAERALRRCQIQAESLRDDVQIGVTLFYYGYFHEKTENWSSAIKYFDKSIGLLQKGTDYYYSSLYHKIHCVIHNRAFSKAKKLLEQAINECSSNEVWKPYFIALEHYLKISNYMTSLNNDDSIDHILYNAIPYFIKMHDYFFAIDYYALLEKHYEKRESMMNSLYMTKAIRDIYKRCYASDGRSNKS